MSDDLATILAKLNDRNASLWTESGEPTIAAASKLAGRDVSREEIRACGRLRNRPGAPKLVEVDHALAIAKAKLAVAEQIQKIAEIKARLKTSSALVAEKHAEIMRASPAPSSDEVYRAHLAALAKHAPAAPIEVRHTSKLDAVLAGSARRGARDVTGNTRKPPRSVRA